MRNQVGKSLLVERLLRIAQRRGKAAAVVIAQITLVVITLGNHHAFLLQDLAKKLEMDRLVIHQYTVEVENQGFDHE